MRRFRYYLLLALMIFVSGVLNLAHADSYSNAVDVFKKSPAVQPYSST